MSKCNMCHKEMKIAKGCDFNMLIDEDGRRWKKIPCGHPNDLMMMYETKGRCHDCGVKIDGYHHDGCDAEKCPKCENQLLSCECEFPKIGIENK